MRRVSIAEIMDATGLSRATVDRVLNSRGRVHPRTRQAVEESVRRLQVPEAPRKIGPAADIVLRTGRGMLNQMRAAWEAAGAQGDFHDMHQSSEQDLLPVLRRLCEDASRPLILTAKNTQAIVDVLKEARRRGKPVITLVSDLPPEARDFHVGIDDRAAGRTAAYLIGRMLGDRPATVAVVVGDVAFRCHEDREIGFRTGLRAHFPSVVVSGEAAGEDQPQLTYEAVARLLERQPGLDAIYNVGGGNFGVARACREAGLERRILLVAHEANAVTTPLMAEGVMDFVIASDPALLLERALARAASPETAGEQDHAWLDFAIYTRFNTPRFASASLSEQRL